MSQIPNTQLQSRSTFILLYVCSTYPFAGEEDEESGKDWSDLEREAAEEDKKERGYGGEDFDRKRKGREAPAPGRRRSYDSDEGRSKKSKHDKSKSSSSNHKSSSHKSPSKSGSR